MSSPTDITDPRSEIYKHPEIEKKFVVYKPNKFQDVKNLLDTLQQKTELKNFYKTIIIDSLTFLDLNSIRDIVTAKGRTEEAVQLNDFGVNLIRMRGIMSQLRDMEQLSIMTAHVKEPDSSTLIQLIKPQLSGKLDVTISGVVDVLGFLDIKLKGSTSTRVFSANRTATILAKDRTEGNLLSEAVENPTFPALLDKIKYEYTGVTY